MPLSEYCPAHMLENMLKRYENIGMAYRAGESSWGPQALRDYAKQHGLALDEQRLHAAERHHAGEVVYENLLAYWERKPYSKAVSAARLRALAAQYTLPIDEPRLLAQVQRAAAVAEMRRGVMHIRPPMLT